MIKLTLNSLLSDSTTIPSKRPRLGLCQLIVRLFAVLEYEAIVGGDGSKMTNSGL